MNFIYVEKVWRKGYSETEKTAERGDCLCIMPEKEITNTVNVVWIPWRPKQEGKQVEVTLLCCFKCCEGLQFAPLV